MLVDSLGFRAPALLVATLPCFAGCAPQPEESTFSEAPAELVSRETVLMGTRARLAAYAATRADGVATLDAALAILEETDRELSTWRDDSDISQLNRWPIDQPWSASGRSCGLFADLIALHERTDGAFDPAVGRLTEAWDIHGTGRVPTGAELSRARMLSGMHLFGVDTAACTVSRRADATIDVGGFGKGEALDRVIAAGIDGPWLIDLGGQVTVLGSPPDGDRWPVALAHPLERDREALALAMPPGSLATSAGSERDLEVDGARVGHILDPRTGQPAPFAGSVSVWHISGLQADALSTALYVMGPEEGLDWARAQGVAAAYLIPDGGQLRVEATDQFEQLMVPQ